MSHTVGVEELRYILVIYESSNEFNSTLIKSWIEDIEKLPEEINKAVLNLNDEQLDTQYRENGWTIRQVVHHIADSHMNAYIRFKLTITEDKPTIKPYFEGLWAELPDS